MCLWGIADEAIVVFLFRERDIACTEKSKDGMIGVRKRKVKKLFKRSGHDYRSIYGTSSAAYHSGDRQR